MSVFIGYDSREADAFAVARASVARFMSKLEINGLHLPSLQEAGLYTRPTSRHPNKGGSSFQLWDDISDAPMSTEFAISRFLTPFLADDHWALFMDCDMLVRTDIRELFLEADERYAVMCVKHNQNGPLAGNIGKMDGQAQTFYARKNWSSLMLINCRHPSNQRLTLKMVNELPGRDLHRFCWLEDDEIGALSVEWNWLAGISDKTVDPKIVHFTLGIPSMRGYYDQEYASEWREELAKWVNGNADLGRLSGIKSPAA